MRRNFGDDEKEENIIKNRFRFATPTVRIDRTATILFVVRIIYSILNDVEGLLQKWILVVQRPLPPAKCKQPVFSLT